jgi:histidine triad (HIT) family protein
MRGMNDCLFCKIIRKELPAEILFEDEKTMVFLDAHPDNPGHALVVPKAHAETFLATSPEDARAVTDTVHHIAPHILAAVGAAACNFASNCGKLAGQVIPHYHHHIIPRFEGDGFTLWHGKNASNDELAATAKKIRDRIC